MLSNTFESSKLLFKQPQRNNPTLKNSHVIVFSHHSLSCHIVFSKATTLCRKCRLYIHIRCKTFDNIHMLDLKSSFLRDIKDHYTKMILTYHCINFYQLYQTSLYQKFYLILLDM
jgi:hypothetical protein